MEEATVLYWSDRSGWSVRGWVARRRVAAVNWRKREDARGSSTSCGWWR